MPPLLHWPSIALRLGLTVLAAALLGIDRSRNGHPAVQRTTLQVTLAAPVAMIQMNLLPITTGKPWNSFVVMDVMRLPLGILTGVDFIGAGTILRRGEMVLGITTAAVLWFSTVAGLCIGGGQMILGSVSAVIGYLILTALCWFESRVEVLQPAILTLVASIGSLVAGELRELLEAALFRVKAISREHSAAEQLDPIRCEVRRPSVRGAADLPPIVDQFRQTTDLIRLNWRAVSSGAK
ncbi:MAG TPA: MgtC/SapB family protein [Acidobacteriaceae bacterium]|nr:MgtC/SapB family protein [Acidobacteriaceae bacterium]